MDDPTGNEKWSGILPDLMRYPVSGAVACAAIIASFYYWSGGDIEPLVMSYRAFTTEPWRLLTTCFPHGDWVHLVFNVYWLMRFGRILEPRQRLWITAVLLVYLAAGSSAAEYAVAYGGIGLSGIGYGLFGFLWVASRLNGAFTSSIDRQTAKIFVGWFFLCILLTEIGFWRVANVAHGTGAVLGAIGALALFGEPETRRRWRVGVATVLCIVGWSATSGREYVNRGDGVAYERSRRAFDAMEEGDCVTAVELYQRSLADDENDEDDWYYLGICYQTLGRSEDALFALRRAHELDREDEDNTDALAETLRELATQAADLSQYDRVVEFMEEVEGLSPVDGGDWYLLARAYRSLGRKADAYAAYSEALQLDPENEERYQNEMKQLGQP